MADLQAETIGSTRIATLTCRVAVMLIVFWASGNRGATAPQVATALPVAHVASWLWGEVEANTAMAQWRKPSLVDLHHRI